MSSPNYRDVSVVATRDGHRLIRYTHTARIDDGPQYAVEREETDFLGRTRWVDANRIPFVFFPFLEILHEANSERGGGLRA